jgi:transposase
MMRPTDDIPEIFLCKKPVDFRKGMGSLATLIEGELEFDPFSSRLFVSTNRRKNSIKVLYWERNGFCLWHKRLEKERFHWFRGSKEAVITLTGQQLNWLLDGYDLTRMKHHKKLEYSFVS